MRGGKGWMAPLLPLFVLLLLVEGLFGICGIEYCWVLALALLLAEEPWL